MQMLECDAEIFTWLPISFGPPSGALVAYHLKMGRIPLHDAVVVNFEKCATAYKAEVPRM